MYGFTDHPGTRIKRETTCTDRDHQEDTPYFLPMMGPYEHAHETTTCGCGPLVLRAECFTVAGGFTACRIGDRIFPGLARPT